LVLFALAESTLGVSVLGAAPGLSRYTLASGEIRRVEEHTALDSFGSALDGETEGAGETVGELSELLVVGVVDSMPVA
jgi:hypothetical protein